MIVLTCTLHLMEPLHFIILRPGACGTVHAKYLIVLCASLVQENNEHWGGGGCEGELN